MTPNEAINAPIPNPAVNETKKRLIALSESIRDMVEILDCKITVPIRKNMIEAIPSTEVKSGKNSIMPDPLVIADDTKGYHGNPL